MNNLVDGNRKNEGFPVNHCQIEHTPWTSRLMTFEMPGPTWFAAWHMYGPASSRDTSRIDSEPFSRIWIFALLMMTAKSLSAKNRWAIHSSGHSLSILLHTYFCNVYITSVIRLIVLIELFCRLNNYCVRFGMRNTTNRGVVIFGKMK